MGFQLVPKSVTLNDPVILGRLWPLFYVILQNSSVWGQLCKVVEVVIHICDTNVVQIIWFKRYMMYMGIFAEFSENEFARERHPLSETII